MRLEGLRRSAEPVVLFVAHAFGGGVERHIRELARGLEGRAAVLLLQPHLETHLVLRNLCGDESPLWFHAAREWNDLLEVLDGIGIDRVHFHHVHGLPSAVLDLPRRFRSPHFLTLHDFFPACPAYHLKDASLRFCGGDPGCQRCLDGGGTTWGVSIEEWRSRFGDLLASAERVIAPSRSAAQTLRAFFPAVSPVVWPHPEDADGATPPPVRVLVPGAISVEKGLDVLEMCMRDSSARGLPLHFRVVGFTGRALPSWPDMPLTVTGQYADGSLPQLLALERGDVIFFPAQCPETFSYTLSAALATMLPIVATDLGAFSERLGARANARIVPWNAPAHEINDALLAMASPLAAAPAHVRDAMTIDVYRERYLEGLRRRSPLAPLAPVHPHWLVEPRHDPAPSSMEWLFDDGVLAGKAASRLELRHRAAQADAQLADARRRLDSSEVQLREARSQIAAQRADAERLAAAAEARLESLLTSRSWRLLSPLRRLARWLHLTREER